MSMFVLAVRLVLHRRSDATMRCDRLLFFFFFQAEDGIRDRDVTGVQTCALPISTRETSGPNLRGAGWTRRCESTGDGAVRSEERRVGKECRSRWAPYH